MSSKVDSAVRYAGNPILTPLSIPPSLPNDMRVVGAFNAAAVSLLSPNSSPSLNGVLLLVRVSETLAVNDTNTEVLHIPLATPASDIKNVVKPITVAKDDPLYDFADSRVVIRRSDRAVAYLTSLSHIRPVFVQMRRGPAQDNGASQLSAVQFDTIVSNVPLLFPGLSTHPDDPKELLELEAWGIEDPRITDLRGLPESFPLRSVWQDGTSGQHRLWDYAITYTVVSPKGAATALSVARVDPAPSNADFPWTFTVRRVSVIFPPENKDVCLFPLLTPSAINPKELVMTCYHRPVPKSFGSPDMWYAESTDGLRWGVHRHILGSGGGGALTQEPSWDAGRVGGGAPSVLIPGVGWLHLYHAADTAHRYCLGAFLAAEDAPHRILGKAALPFLTPTEPYEVKGFFPNVVFTCGVVRWDPALLLSTQEVTKEADGESLDWLVVFYGAADDKIGVCWVSVKQLIASMHLQ